MKQWGLCGGSDTGQSHRVNSERSVNLYPERQEAPQAQTPQSLLATPGLARFNSTDVAGPWRGLFFQDGNAYGVVGAAFVKINEDSTITTLGAVANDGGPATMHFNGELLLIIAGGEGYTYTPATSTFAVIADANFPPNAVMAEYLGDLFLVLDALGIVYYSDDGLAWDPTDLVIKSNTSDRVKAIVVHNQQLWLLGSKSTEVWFLAEDGLFHPVGGIVLDQGIAAPWSVGRIAGSLFWLAKHTQGAALLVRTQGYALVPVSTPAQSYQIGQVGEDGAARAWTYQQHGHEFYVLSLATQTLVYDATTGLWHERAYLNPVTGAFEAHLGQCHCYAFNTHLVGSRRDGILYRMDTDLYSDAGEPIRRVRRAAHVSSEQRIVFYRALTVDMQVGVGLATGQGSDPQVMLRFSDDGGTTWSQERSVSLGAIGAYRQRVVFRRLGRARDRVFEVAISDPVPVVILDGYLTVEAAA